MLSTYHFVSYMLELSLSLSLSHSLSHACARDTHRRAVAFTHTHVRTFLAE
jgi:hypothetical protein